jgi:N6-L-threonylcarbamoyladenine synthase
LSDVVYTQLQEHEKFGGVVPEVGSRAHIAQISQVFNKSLTNAKIDISQIDAVATTVAPGLMGPLLVGSQFAKGFSLARDIPFLGIHHIEGHIFSGLGEKDFPSPPFMALIVSGGHTSLYVVDKNYSIKEIGKTRDDAAGEAFDKIGRMMGLAYPAGKEIDLLASRGDKKRFEYPISFRNSTHFDFSFSGLKTAVRNHLLQIKSSETQLDTKLIHDLCASVSEAICIALYEKTLAACKKYSCSKIVFGGGVAANSRLRTIFDEDKSNHGLDYFFPAKNLCTDNAVMIGRAAMRRFLLGQSSSWQCDVLASLPVAEANSLVV